MLASLRDSCLRHSPKESLTDKLYISAVKTLKIMNFKKKKFYKIFFDLLDSVLKVDFYYLSFAFDDCEITLG
jgi:hypothetical protein